MSWFGSSAPMVANLDRQIHEATSESIPNGELDLSTALEVTDIIRSKAIPAQQCMRALKKRIGMVFNNPNLLKLSLQLTDLCVKNGGYHFLVEVSSKEFIDYLVDFVFKVHYNLKKPDVAQNEARKEIGNLILSLVRSWAHFFENLRQLEYTGKAYAQLVKEGYKFPENKINGALTQGFIDSEAPPDWIDSNECMICYAPFSLINRKHHCRSCGGVYCQTHSSHNAPLTSMGIINPVRVCDNCYAKMKSKNDGVDVDRPSRKGASRKEHPVVSEEEQLKKAIELSLKESNSTAGLRKPSKVESDGNDRSNDEDEDKALKLAIERSLRDSGGAQKTLEFQQQQQQQQQYQQQQEQQEEASEFYSNILPENYSHLRSSETMVPQQSGVTHVSTQNRQSQIEGNITGSSNVGTEEMLTQNEEDTVNLFHSLMNKIKSSPEKQANILYDTQLADLHSKVIRIRPKLNKSFREAVEKYESCVEISNKIATISRLYNQFLENKLSLVYGNYSISDGNTGYYKSPLNNISYEEEGQPSLPYPSRSPHNSPPLHYPTQQPQQPSTPYPSQYPHDETRDMEQEEGITERFPSISQFETSEHIVPSYVTFSTSRPSSPPMDTEEVDVGGHVGGDEVPNSSEKPLIEL